MLAELHSKAVDYPKSGIPVSQRGLPRVPKVKPDWSAPETVEENNRNFYTSQRALGQLFRDINLPATNAAKTRKSKAENEDVEFEIHDLDDALNRLSLLATYPEDPISKALYIKLSEWVDEDEEDITDLDWIRKVFSTYSQELFFICRNHTLSFKKGSRLSEEEVLIGSILAKTSQPRRRKDLMSQMRERATVLVSQIKEELSGKDIPPFNRIRHAWAAWRFSRFLAERNHFGAESFGIIAIGSFLDTVVALETMQR
jgi:RNA-dependent RNA polymerase